MQGGRKRETRKRARIEGKDRWVGGEESERERGEKEVSGGKQGEWGRNQGMINR